MVNGKNVDNYYSVKLTNNMELFIRAGQFVKTIDFLKALDSGTFSSNFIKLKQVNTERERQPVFYSKNAIMTVEKVSHTMIGNNTKLWEIVE